MHPIPVVAQAVFNGTPDAVFLLDQNREIHAMNPAAEFLTGRASADVVLQKTCRLCLDCHDADGQQFPDPCPCMQVLHQDVAAPYFELQVRDATGNRRPVAVSASPVMVGDQQLTAVVMRDISERVRLEDALDRRRREAEFLYDAGRRIAAVANLEEGTRAVLSQLVELMDLVAAGWCEVPESEQAYTEWRVRTWVGPAAHTCPDRLPAHWLQSGEVHGGLQIVVGAETTVAPLRVGDRVLGLLVTVGPTLDDAARQVLAAVAHQLAVALENTRLYGRARDLAVSEERHRLGAEMHDSLAQTLAIIHSRVRQLPDRLGAGSTEEALASVQALERVVQQAHREVRQAIFDLKSPIGHGGAFVTGLREYLEEFELQAGLSINAELPDEELRLPLQIEVQLFRILQEALNNARRHSGAKQVNIKLHQGEDGLWHLRVSDSGRGFDPRRGRGRGHFGLHIMQERAKAIGGLLAITSAPGRGTQVEVEFPPAQE